MHNNYKHTFFYKIKYLLKCHKKNYLCWFYYFQCLAGIWFGVYVWTESNLVSSAAWPLSAVSIDNPWALRGQLTGNLHSPATVSIYSPRTGALICKGCYSWIHHHHYQSRDVHCWIGPPLWQTPATCIHR